MMSVADTERVTHAVRELYTSHPYPDPRLVAPGRTTITALLDFVKALYWPFRPSLDGVRVLDAGCGTGVGSISIASRHPEVEVLAIDISAASLELAESAAKERGLRNLTFRQASVLDAAELGRFHYIVSSGVVHHLADPVAGLRAMREALTPDGVLMGMVYAQYGRTGVYVLQEAFRRLAPEGYRTVSPETARAIATSLPSGHPFRPGRFAEMDWEDDCGIVDLLLHPQDRAYTVPQLIGACEQAGLQLRRFVAQHAYEPTSYALPEAERERAVRLPDRERWALSELLHGSMVKHEFLATRDSFEPFTIEADGLVLLAMRLRRSPTWAWAAAKEHRATDGSLLYELREWTSSASERSITLPAWQFDFLRGLDGETTALDAFKRARVPAATEEEKLQIFGMLLKLLVDQEVLLVDPS